MLVARAGKGKNLQILWKWISKWKLKNCSENATQIGNQMKNVMEMKWKFTS